MEENEIMKKILEEEDFIHSKKFNNSLSKMLTKISEDGVEDSVIAKVLMLTEEQVADIYQESVEKLREDLTEE